MFIDPPVFPVTSLESKDVKSTFTDGPGTARVLQCCCVSGDEKTGQQHQTSALNTSGLADYVPPPLPHVRRVSLISSRWKNLLFQQFKSGHGRQGPLVMCKHGSLQLSLGLLAG